MLVSCIILSVLSLLLVAWVDRYRPSPKHTAFVLVLLLLFPFTQLLPKASLPAIGQSGQLHEASLLIQQVYETASPQLSFGWHQLITILWILGSVFCIIRLVRHIITIRRCIKAATIHTDTLHETVAHKLGLTHTPRVATSSEIASPIICGLFQPVVLLPTHSKEWSAQTLEMVLLHEFSHYKRKDLWLITLAHLCCAIHWYNPLVWKLKTHYINQCEFACDAEVLSVGTNKKQYIHALCDMAASHLTQPPHSPELVSKSGTFNNFATLSMVNKATLRRRVQSMIQGSNPPHKVMTYCLIGLMSTSSLAMTLLRPEHSSRNDIGAFTQPLSIDNQALSREGTYSVRERKQDTELRLTANPFPLD